MHIQRRVGSKAAAREGCGKAKRRTDIVSLWPVAAAGSLLLQYDCVTFLSYLEVLKEGEASPAAAAGPAYRPASARSFLQLLPRYCRNFAWRIAPTAPERTLANLQRWCGGPQGQESVWLFADAAHTIYDQARRCEASPASDMHARARARTKTAAAWWIDCRKQPKPEFGPAESLCSAPPSPPAGACTRPLLRSPRRRRPGPALHRRRCGCWSRCPSGAFLRALCGRLGRSGGG